MKELNGISASPGIVIGRVFLFLEDNFNLPEFNILEQDIEAEITRLEEAVAKSHTELEELRKNIKKSGQVFDESRLVDAHIMMLNDPEFLSQVYESIRSELMNAESVLLKTSRSIIGLLEQSEDDYLRERTVDIHDVTRRVLNNLMMRSRNCLADLKEEIILVGKNLMPSDTLTMNKKMVKGIAMDMGGKASHTAILARSFEIPTVLGLRSISSLVRKGDMMIIDGNHGKVFVNPDEKTIEKYKTFLAKWKEKECSLRNLNKLTAKTKDGKQIKINANIEIPDEVESALAHGADGIGLYRSEFLFLKPGIFNDEDEQVHFYKKVVEAMKGAPVTIRTLDLGGDKNIPFMSHDKEDNPILGWRSIRFCLSNPDIFKIQLKALLRASMFGSLQIMFPMISSLHELDQSLALLDKAKEELKQENKEFKDNIQVGMMIEVPSAALISDIFAKKVDFFSIGTNDLIQYAIAVDRGNEKVAYLYNAFHPGILRLLKMIIDNAHKHHIPVGLCGEMAGDPLATVVLLGLGLDSYSMSSSSIPEVKQVLRSISTREAEVLVCKIMEMETPESIEKYIREWINERIDFFTF